MASNRKDKKLVPDMTIFEEKKKAKISARKTLEIAKKQDSKHSQRLHHKYEVWHSSVEMDMTIHMDILQS